MHLCQTLRGQQFWFVILPWLFCDSCFKQNDIPCLCFIPDSSQFKFITPLFCIQIHTKLSCLHVVTFRISGACFAELSLAVLNLGFFLSFQIQVEYI